MRASQPTLPGIAQRMRRASDNKPQLYFAVRPGYPDAERAADVVRTTKAIVKAGADGISCYNFGLLEKPHMEWVKQAVSAI